MKLYLNKVITLGVWCLLFVIPHFLEGCDKGCPVSPLMSHSTFLAKPLSQNVVLELGMTNYFRYHSNYNFYQDDSNSCSDHEYCGNIGFIFDIQPFFFVSTRFLLPPLAHLLASLGELLATFFDSFFIFS